MICNLLNGMKCMGGVFKPDVLARVAKNNRNSSENSITIGGVARCSKPSAGMKICEMCHMTSHKSQISPPTRFARFMSCN